MRAMKDSGIEWIGEIPESWTTDKTIRIFQIIGSGTTPKSGYEEYYNGDIHWIQSGDINGSTIISTKVNVTQKAVDSISALKVYEKPFIIMAMYGASIGNISISEIDGCVNQACCVFKEGQQDFMYSFYCLRAAKAFFVWNAVGGGQPNISQDTLKQLRIPMPPLPEQQAISAYLDRQCALIDSITEKTKATIEEYKKLRQAVITQAVTKGVRGDRPMKDSGIERIDKIPSEWTELKMKYFMYIRARLGWKGLKADEYVDEGYIFIGTPNIDERGEIDWINVNYITQERYDESPEIKLSEGDVLLTKDGAGIGKCAYIDYLPQEAAPNSSLAVITCNDVMQGKYLFYYLKSYYFQKYIDQIKAGMGVPHLFQGDLKEITIAVPSIKEQSEITIHLDKKCAEIDSIIAKKEQFLTELETYKKSMIYEYVTGKKEVPQA